MDVAVLAYEGVSALEIAGPHEVLARLPGAAVRLLSPGGASVATERETLRFVTGALGTAPRPEVLVIPGSRRGVASLLSDASLVRWVREASAASRYTLAVAEGVELLGAAGALRGRRATTHWRSRATLAAHGAEPVPEGVAVDGRVLTASGASGAIEAAFRVAEEVAGVGAAKAIQLATEYDPAPPFDAGAPERAEEAVRARAEALIAAPVEGDGGAALEVALLAYEGFTGLDLIGPYEVLARAPGLRTVLVAPGEGPVASDTGALRIVPGATLGQVRSPAVALVPGASFTFVHYMGERAVLDWLRAVRPTARVVGSVCVGSMILAAAGMLEGREATSHWFAAPELARFGARPVTRRWVDEGDVVTAAGVSAGIDLALALVARLEDATTARAIQLAMGYDPKPPYDCGSLPRAPGPVRRDALRRLLFNPDLGRAMRVVSPGRSLDFMARVGWRYLTRPGSWPAGA